MDNKNNLNLGNEIKDILRDALNNNNFNKLNQNIESITRNTINKLKGNNVKTLNYKKLFTPNGKTSGVLFTVFGAIGIFTFGISILVLTILSLPFGRLFNAISLILLPFFIISVVLLIKGIKTLTRLKRAKKYLYSMKGKSYVLIEDIAKRTGLNKRFIEKDLLQMINLRFFPEGHIDAHRTYFILDNETYKQYIDLQTHIQEEKIEEEARQADYKDLDSDIKRVREEGRRVVSQIREANKKIEEREISLKLDKLEQITEKIFLYVEQNPKKLPEIRKFSEYFLPTTLKLIETYKNLDCEPIEGQNILNVKKEIEETLDTINIAFENLLDGLFEDIAMDISTDISVLQTMLMQEGLTETITRDSNKNN